MPMGRRAFSRAVFGIMMCRPLVRAPVIAPDQAFARFGRGLETDGRLPVATRSSKALGVQR